MGNIRQSMHSYNQFIEGSFTHYLNGMQRSGVYGDHITLQVLAREYKIQFLVVSSVGLTHTRIVSNTGLFDNTMITLNLGHLPEGQGEHYLSLDVKDHTFELITDRIRADDDERYGNRSADDRAEEE